MSNFCVYLHRRKDTNEIFYVGEGTLKRPFASCKATRSIQWKTIVAESGGFIVQIYRTGLTKAEARQLELEIISKTPNLINNLSNKHPREITKLDVAVLTGVLEYSISSPSGLVWKTTGKPAGSLLHKNNKKYWRVSYSGREYKCHRLVMVLHGHELPPDLVVDHLDGNSLNNQYENLRITSQTENMKNVNTKNSLNQGVSFCKRDCRWIARWQEQGKQVSKSFSVQKYGEKAKELALQHRANKSQ